MNCYQTRRRRREIRNFYLFFFYNHYLQNRRGTVNENIHLSSYHVVVRDKMKFTF